MARYVDTDALNWWDDLFMKGKNDSGVWVRYKDVESFIKNAPTADVQEVKHGKWIKRYFGGSPLWDEETVCSECLHTGSEHFSYCPNCGAKMDKEDEENGEIH